MTDPVPTDTAALERALESLNKSEQTLEAERTARLETDAMLDGLRKLVSAGSSAALDRALLGALRGIFSLAEAVLLVPAGDELVSSPETAGAFACTRWAVGPLFRRVLAGQYVAVFDVSAVAEWAEQPDEVRAGAGSLLHVPLVTARRSAILLLVHPEAKAFSPRHAELARRFMSLVVPLVEGMDARELDSARVAAEERAMALERQHATVVEQLETIRQQQEQIEQLAAPTIPLWPGVILVPLVGTLGPDQAQAATERILETMSRARASEVLLDLTGFDDDADEHVVARIAAIVGAVKLMGGRCHISGMKPAMAQFLAASGTDVSQLRTSASLGEAVSVALAQLGYKVARPR